ncbi:hypothetical protein U1Q18_007719, partial [Sarracenia purpurea var. burkii]
VVEERRWKHLSGRFQWFWDFGQNGGEGTSERGGGSESTKASGSGNDQNDTAATSSMANRSEICGHMGSQGFSFQIRTEPPPTGV